MPLSINASTSEPGNIAICASFPPMVTTMIVSYTTDREQLAVCRQWVTDPHLRPLTFRRLQRLAAIPSLAGDVRSLATQLSEDPALLPWLRSYGLADASVGPGTSSG